MKLALFAATALTMAGSALAYQTQSGTDPATTTSTETMTTTTAAAVPIDPTMALTPPHTWTAEQRDLWDQHMASLPTAWTADQRSTFEAMMALPPAGWSPEQRALYEQHMASLPATWTAEQRAMYEQQVASLRTPWAGTQQMAAVGPSTTTAAQPNVSTFAGMGGPYEDVYGAGSVSLTPRPADANYPPCSPGPGDDNCIQLYERGVRDQLASWSRPTGGLQGSETAMGGPFEPADQSSQAAMSSGVAETTTGVGATSSGSTGTTSGIGTMSTGTSHTGTMGTTTEDPVDTQSTTVPDDATRTSDPAGTTDPTY
ncbi:hypothetical protein [Sphingosinicella sp. CPCC 101087]|uniref:hypothetical protein n=1 Tax=Sphingosinicella sp. CPCC 101087 TaxID=2497754 RepID=UPI00101CBE68|nr:hypothetical protein [Sphingosinicella sp. CPCC 101087]